MKMEREKITEYVPYFVMTLCCMLLGVIAGIMNNIVVKICLMVVAVGLGVLMLRRTRVMEESK